MNVGGGRVEAMNKLARCYQFVGAGEVWLVV